MAQGGNTNMGAPSHNFNDLPEYAYSAAILSVDLNAIGNTTYDLPTLVDEDHPTSPARSAATSAAPGEDHAASPVQVYAPGFRNPFAWCKTRLGKLYAVDNGPNAGWGDVPVGAGPGGTCTNAVHEPRRRTTTTRSTSSPARATTAATPTRPRGTAANTFNTTNPQSPVPAANPDRVRPRDPATNGSLASFDTATTGMAEYTASELRRPDER